MSILLLLPVSCVVLVGSILLLLLLLRVTLVLEAVAGALSLLYPI